jgi:hypothetical protein
VTVTVPECVFVESKAVRRSTRAHLSHVGIALFARPRPVPDYNPDLDRAKQDRLSGGSGGLVSLAYWIVRAVQGLYRLLRRRKPS